MFVHPLIKSYRQGFEMKNEPSGRRDGTFDVRLKLQDGKAVFDFAD